MKAVVHPLWKLAVLLALVVALFSIYRNRGDINQVCAVTQRQMDRNEATLTRALEGLRDIEDGEPTNAPGEDYYRQHPDELDAAINRTITELRTYQGEAC